MLPKPVQQPHPPLWYAGTSPPSFELAGRNGVGILCMTIFQTLDELGSLLDIYREAISSAKPVGAYVNDQVGVFTLAQCADSVDAARANGGPDACVYYITAALHLVAAGLDPDSMEEALKKFGDGDPANPYGSLIATDFVGTPSTGPTACCASCSWAICHRRRSRARSSSTAST